MNFTRLKMNGSETPVFGGPTYMNQGTAITELQFDSLLQSYIAAVWNNSELPDIFIGRLIDPANSTFQPL